MWILTTPRPAVVPVYNSTDMERRLVRQAHLVLVYDSFESCTLLGGAFCVAHRALLNMEFVTASYSTRTSLECVSNETDIFFRGPCLSRRFYTQQTTCSPQFVVPEPNAFPCSKFTSMMP
jgi:hypothetical protein